MTDSEDTSKINIKQNLSIINALKKRTAETVQSLSQPSEESSSSNLPVPQGKALSEQLPAVYGGPSEAKDLAKNNLINVGKKLSPEMTEESVNILTSFVDKVSKGPGSALPMRCRGEKCTFLNVCPLYAAKVSLPIGHKCPVEENIVVLWVNKHLMSLGIENIDNPENSFDMDMLYELATQELIRYRCGAILSERPDLVENKKVGESFSGSSIFADVIHPALEIMEKSGKNVSRLREALLATRRAQLRVGEVVVDATQKASDLRQQALEISRNRLKKAEDIKSAEFRVIEEEEEDEEL